MPGGFVALFVVIMIAAVAMSVVNAGKARARLLNEPVRTWIEARYGIPHRFLDHPSGL